MKHGTIRRIGNSMGITIPAAYLERLNLHEGDQVHFVDTADALVITPYDPDFERTMKLYREEEARFRDVGRELAKQ